MELLIGALVVIVLLLFVAPRFGIGTEHKLSLATIQSILTITSLVLVAVRDVILHPDEARLTYEQAVTAAPMASDRALVIVGLTVANVGTQTADLRSWPYYVVVQRVSSLEPAADLGPEPIKMPAILEDAYNWPGRDLLAYRIAGRDREHWKATSPGLTARIPPGESETFYFRAPVPCATGERISVSSRIDQPRRWLDRLAGKAPAVSIKQSFVDLTQLCESAHPAK